MPRLTARSVDAAKPGEKRREIPDAGLPGLVLVVQPSGAKAYVLRYRFGGKSRRLTLGRHPVVGLAEARDAGREALARLDAGEDPAQARAVAKEKRARVVDPVEEIVADYLRRDAARNRSAEAVAATFARHVLPHWSGRSVHDLTRRDVLALLDRLVDDGKPVMANRTLAAVRRFMNFCVERDILAASPAAGVKAPAKETPRDRVLSDDELRWLWQASERVGHPFGPLARLLVLTGARIGEVAGMRDDEIDGAVWHLPAQRTKNGRAHALPLTRAAREIIDAAPRIAPPPGGAQLVFSTTGATPVSGWSRARARLHAQMQAAAERERGERVEIPDWSLHDLRRTCATGLARIGTPVHVTERVLNHVSGTQSGIVAVYQRHSYADEMRAALERWAAEVERIVDGKPVAKVVPLR